MNRREKIMYYVERQPGLTSHELMAKTNLTKDSLNSGLSDLIGDGSVMNIMDAYYPALTEKLRKVMRSRWTKELKL